MSLTARERHNPPPRQRSCAACIKAKRRCDAAVPACLRCAQRGIPCEWPAAAASRRSHRGSSIRSPAVVSASTPSHSCLASITPTQTPTPSPPSPQITHHVGGGFVNSMDTSSFLSPPPPHHHIVDNQSCASQYGGLMSSLDPMLEMSSAGAGTTTFDDAFAETLPTNFLFQVLEKRQAELEMLHQPSMLAAPTSRPFDRLPDVVAMRLDYAINEIKKAPSSMVLETQTPWCHPKLYEREMPRSMRDAHAACALYMAKNRTNSQVILRSIEAKVNDLLQAPAPTSPLESLAHTQSLLLYHIIRIFDGDISARASAERTQAALEDSAMSLIVHVDFNCPTPEKEACAAAESSAAAMTATSKASATSGQQQQHCQERLPLYPLAPTRQFWHEWILQESGRRTLLFTFFFLQAYRILSGQRVDGCDGRLGLCHSFTLSASLWHAESSLAFGKAWRERKHVVIDNTDFQIAFGQAQADDLDLFGRMMLTSVIGVDEAEGWFASRGGSLWEAKGATAAV